MISKTDDNCLSKAGNKINSYLIDITILCLCYKRKKCPHDLKRNIYIYKLDL